MICKKAHCLNIFRLNAAGIMAVLLMLAISWSVSYAGSDTRTVATGTAMIRGGNIAGARQDATMNALRQALEQGVGMFMDSKTILENENLTETIFTNTQGYISSYEIISEEERGGLYRVKIQAILKKDAIRSTLDTLGIIEPIMDYPRIMILSSPEQEISPVSRSVETVLARNFTAKHFHLVDLAQSRKLHKEAGRLLKTDSVRNEAAGLGLKHEAEIVFLYGTRTGTPEYDGIMESVPVGMRAQAIVTTTAQVLTAQEKTVQGVGNTPDLAARNGAARAADAVSNYMIKAIASWWDDYAANGLPYTVTLKTAPRADLLVMDFEQTLRQVRGVVSVAERNSGGGITEMMVKFKGSGIELKDAVMKELRGRKGFRKLHLVSSGWRNMAFSTK